MNNLIFYFQFVYYSNEELFELKKLISNCIPHAEAHLISNKDMLEKFGINNSIGRIIYIKKTDVNLSEYLNFNSLLEPITKVFNQLNLYLIQINNLFLNISMAQKYLKIQKDLNFFSNLNRIVLLNSFYLLNWMYMNMFHKKLCIISKNISLNSIYFNKIYNTDYL